MTLTDPQFVIVLGYIAWAVIVGWAIALAWRAITDKRSREGTRCRDCWYDLRGTTGATCPECGSKLAERGVYPPGCPGRGGLVNIWAAWTTLIALAAACGSVVFHRNCWTVSGVQRVDFISIGDEFGWYMELKGDQRTWPWSPDVHEVPASWKLLHVRFQGAIVHYAVDGDTIQIHAIRKRRIVIPRHSLDGRSVAEDVVAETRPGYRETIERWTTRLAPTLDWARRVDRITIQGHAEREYWQAHVVPVLGEQVSRASMREPIFSKRPAPRWVMVVPVGLSVLLWLIGLPLIARWWRGRNLVAWVPQATPVA